MESGVYSTLSDYFKAGGQPGEVVDLLSDNYKGLAQVYNTDSLLGAGGVRSLLCPSEVE